MKAFFRKLKKQNKTALIIYLLIVILYSVGSIIITKNVLALKGIENTLRIIAIMFIHLLNLIYIIFGFLSIMDHRKKTFIFLSIFNFIFVPIFIVGSFFINVIFDRLNGLNQEYITYTTNLVTLNNHKFSNKDKIGMIKEENDIEGYILPNEYMDQEDVKNEIVYYDDYIEMLIALYEKKIDSIFITSNYVILFEGEEYFKDIASVTKVVDSYSKKMKNQEVAISSTKSLDEPFTLLLMGVDSEKDGLDANMAFNGDTLMLITFNPNTLNATMFSIPRDMYVPISCRNNAKAKINSSAAYGTQCVIDTVEAFTDIQIDYYVKINFKGVVDLVNALDGVNVEVGKDFCEQNSDREWGNKQICLKAGFQELDGEEALAFSRHRHSLLRGDIDRIQNQQKVVEAIAKKTKGIRTFKEFEKVLDSITNNMVTNLTTDQILSFYEVGKNMVKNSLHGDDFITIDKTYLEYYDLPIYLAGSNTVTSALGYYSNSLEAIKNLMKNNLNDEDTNIYTDFNYTYKEEYETIITGKGITGVRDTKTMANLVGKDLGAAQYFATQNDIQLFVEEVTPDSEFYNTNVSDGLIGSQSIRYGSILGTTNTITIYINKAE